MLIGAKGQYGSNSQFFSATTIPITDKQVQPPDLGVNSDGFWPSWAALVALIVCWWGEVIKTRSVGRVLGHFDAISVLSDCNIDVVFGL